MFKIGFCTPIIFDKDYFNNNKNNQDQRVLELFLETIDAYFDLGLKPCAKFSKEKEGQCFFNLCFSLQQPFIVKVIKIISYCLIVTLIVCLILKILLRIIFLSKLGEVVYEEPNVEDTTESGDDIRMVSADPDQINKEIIGLLDVHDYDIPKLILYNLGVTFIDKPRRTSSYFSYTLSHLPDTIFMNMPVEEARRRKLLYETCDKIIRDNDLNLLCLPEFTCSDHEISDSRDKICIQFTEKLYDLEQSSEEASDLMCPQETCYRNLGNLIDPAMAQLAEFIGKTNHLMKATYESCPILKKRSPEGQARIILGNFNNCDLEIITQQQSNWTLVTTVCLWIRILLGQGLTLERLNTVGSAFYRTCPLDPVLDALEVVARTNGLSFNKIEFKNRL